MNVEWTEDRIAKAVQLYAEGKTFGEIAKELRHISRSAVGGYITRHRNLFPERPGAKIGRPRKDKPILEPVRKVSAKTPEYVLAQIETLWLKGHSLNAIAHALKMSKSTVSTNIHKDPVRFPPRQTKPKIINRQVKVNGALEKATKGAPVLQGIKTLDFSVYKLEHDSIAFVNHTRDRCIFPVSEDNGPHAQYCGGEVAYRGYCATHARLSYQPIMYKKKAA